MQKPFWGDPKYFSTRLKEYKGPIWKSKTVKVPHCPDCGKEVERLTNPDHLTVATWRCEHCGWMH